MASLPPLPNGFVVEAAPAPASRPRQRPPEAYAPVSDGRSAALSVYPDLQITQVERDPYSRLGRANPNSWHNRTHAAIDARPIPGMSFDDYVNGYRSAGYHILEQIDEVSHPSRHATGPHWHVVLAGGPTEGGGDEPVGDLPPIPAGFQVDAHAAATPTAPHLLNLAPPALPGGPGLVASAPPPDPEIQAVVQGAFGPGPPDSGLTLRGADVRANSLAVTAPAPPPPTGYVADPNNVATQHSALASEVPTAQVTTRDDPRLRGANSQIAGMLSDPNISRAQIEQALLHYGADPAAPSIRRTLDWRESGGLRAWLAAPTNRRRPFSVNIDDIRLPEGQYREVTTPENVPQGEIRNYEPRLTERVAHVLSAPDRMLSSDPRGAAVEEHQRAEILQNPLSPVQAVEDAQDYAERARVAQLENRPLDAAGNQLGAGVATLGVIPVVGRARTGAEVAGRALAEIEALAARYGVREAGPAADATLARLVTAHFSDLTLETQNALAGLARPAAGEAVPDVLASAHIGDLRSAANPPPSMLQRGVQAVRDRLGRNPAPEAADIAPREVDRLDLTQPLPARSGKTPAPAESVRPSASPSLPAPDEGRLPQDLPNTRGQGVYYHGARGEVPELTEGYYNPANIYGGMDTFYTTDAADIASGYGRRRRSARIYSTEERGPVQFFDMEMPLPIARLERLFGVRPDDLGLTASAIEEVAGAKGAASLREVMDEIRDASAGEGVSRDEVHEIFDNAIHNLRGEGFGGMSHTGGLKTGREPHNVRIYFDAPNQLHLRDVTPPRTVDRLDIRELPPIPPGFTLEEPLGRLHPLGEQPAPADLADVARSIRPEDVVPIPDNAIASAEEAARANPGTIQDVRAPAPEAMLEMRSIPDPRKPGETIRFRGPVDAESYLRLRGGVNDSEGELRHIGITPRDNQRPRPEAPGEHRLGPIISGRGLTLDQAGEALHEAGYLRERPTTADVVEILRESRLGRRLWHDRDLEEVAGHEGARAQQMQVDAAREAGVPLAERVGHPVGPADLSANDPPATAYEDLPRIGGRVANINLANIESEGDIRRLLQTVEDRFGGLDASRRGKITHAETRALASELGMTADDLLRRRPGQALNAEQALAARQLLAKSSDEVIALAARATGPEASDASRSAFSEALLRHAAIHEQVTGATAEAGRALSAMRAAARSREISGTIHQAAADGMGGQKRLEEVAEKILDLHREGVGPGEVNRFAVRATRPRFRDKLVELWYNSLLSGPRTHVVNMLSNLMTAALQIPEHAAAAGIGASRRIGRALMGKEHDFDRVMASEIGARTFGLMQGTSEGLRAFARTMRTGEVADHVTKVEARTQHAISGLKGSILRTPTRALAAEDEFFKAIGRRMELNGLAVRKATSEGLRGAALRRRIADLSTNPTDEMVSASMAYARYVTFQRPLEPDSLAQGISRLTQNRPWLKLFVPFVRTPANLLKFAVERSPAAFALRSVRADFAAGGARRDLAIARMALGTGLAMTIAELASRGIITGGGPADRGALDLMRGDGWQPYSIRIGDTYYSYARMDPLSTTIGITADMVDFNQHMTAGQRQQAAPLLIASIIRNLGNKTWLSGISDVVSAIDDPQRSLPNLLARLGGSIAVPAIVSQTAGVLDPTMRDTRAPTFNTEGVVPEALGLRSVIDPTIATIQSRLPGVSQNLPARRDVWGEPITREGSLGPDILSPFSTSTARNDPVTAELLNLGASIGRPSRSIQGRRLEPGEYGQYQALSGRYMREDMIETMGGPDWARMTPEERLREIASIKRTARRDARADLLLDAPPLPPGFQPAH